MQKFLVNTSGFSRETATWIMTIALALYAALQPVAGALSDRIGRRPLMIGFGVAGMGSVSRSSPVGACETRGPTA